MLVNTWSDIFTHFRWEYILICLLSKLSKYRRWISQSNCHSAEANPFWNSTGCDIVQKALPSCMDALQYALENSTEHSRLEAFTNCFDAIDQAWEGTDRDPYDYRRKVCLPLLPNCLCLRSLISVLLVVVIFQTILGLYKTY